MNRWIQRGVMAEQQGQLGGAIGNYAESVAHYPDEMLGYRLLAEALGKAGRDMDALNVFREALKRNPNDMDQVSAMGHVAIQMCQWKMAEQLFVVYITKRPEDPLGYNNLATAWRGMELLEESVALLQHILLWNEKMQDASYLWNTLGASISDLYGLRKGIPYYELAVEMNPSAAQFVSNLAKAYEDLGEFETGAEIAAKASKLDNQIPEPHMVATHCLLAQGELEEAWSHYGARWHPHRPDVTYYGHGLPAWNHWTSFEGHHGNILIMAEQGVGDELLYTSTFREFIESVRPWGIMIACDKRLVPLFKRSFPECEVSYYQDQRIDGKRVRTAPELQDRADYAIPMADVFAHVRATKDSFIQTHKWVQPDNSASDRWINWLFEIGSGPHVGVSWRSQKQTGTRKRGYLKPEDLGPILRTPGVDFVNLQYDDCEEELKQMEELFGVNIQRPPIDLKNDLDGTVALTAALDAVISPASAPGMMAMAVGTPLIAVLRTRPWWTFGKTDGTTPLSSSATLHWQDEADGGWEKVVCKAAASLELLRE